MTVIFNRPTHLNFLRITFKCLIRPVPVVFLRWAFTLQLTVRKRNWIRIIPYDAKTWLFRNVLTMPKFLAWVSTLSTLRLLNMIRRPSTTTTQSVRLVMTFTKTWRTFRLKTNGQLWISDHPSKIDRRPRHASLTTNSWTTSQTAGSSK